MKKENTITHLPQSHIHSLRSLFVLHCYSTYILLTLFQLVSNMMLFICFSHSHFEFKENGNEKKTNLSGDIKWNFILLFFIHLCCVFFFFIFIYFFYFEEIIQSKLLNKFNARFYMRILCKIDDEKKKTEIKME